MTSIALVVISDGRVDYLAQTLASLEAQVDWPFVRKVIVDDSGDNAIWWRLQDEFPEYETIHHRRRSGIAAAVQSGWAAALETDCDYVFHLEQDFTFNGPAPVAEMVALLEDQPHLAHLVLKRDPYSPEEVAAGDFMRCNTDLYEDREHVAWWETDDPAMVHCKEFHWVEWDALFSCNPSLIRRKAIEVAPFTSESEFAKALIDAGYRFAFYGKKSDPPRVTHIGTHRALGWKP